MGKLGRVSKEVEGKVCRDHIVADFLVCNCACQKPDYCLF